MKTIRVEVPETNLDVSDDQMAQLQFPIDPLSERQKFGVDLFLLTLELLRTFALFCMDKYEFMPLAICESVPQV